jgi:type IV pilus assembly protein PilE
MATCNHATGNAKNYSGDHLMKISRFGITANRMQGFTLIELMIVIVIVAILVSIGYPSYTQYLTRAKRQAAKNMIYQITDRQEQFFLDNRSYAANLTALGFAADTMALDRNGQITDASDTERTYTFDLTNTSATTYTVSIAPQLAQASHDSACGTLTLTHTGNRDNSGTATNCW